MTLKIQENSTLPRFWGEFEHSVDDKGRLLLPSELRDHLGDEFVITRGPDKALYLLPKPVWAEIERRLDNALLQREAGFLQRMFGGRTLVKPDPQSRLAIPQHLREWAEIDSSHKAVLVGQGLKVEVWMKDNWQAFCRENFSANAMYSAIEATEQADAA